MGLVLLTSCHLVAQIDEDYREVTCDERGMRCEGIAPPGWSGPLTVFLAGTEPAACAGDQAEEMVIGRGLFLPPSDDPCGCEPAPEACWVRLVSSWQYQCYAFDGLAGELPPASCVAVNLYGQYLRIDPQAEDGLDCVATRADALPPPTWQQLARACSAAPAIGRCEPGQVCQPARPDIALACIAQPGEVTCPAGPYAHRATFFSRAHDTRRCDCGVGSGTCSGQVAFFDDFGAASALENCQGKKAARVPVHQANFDTCFGPAHGKYARMTLHDGAVTCSTAGEDAIAGQVEPDGPVTLCCTTPIEDAPEADTTG